MPNEIYVGAPLGDPSITGDLVANTGSASTPLGQGSGSYGLGTDQTYGAFSYDQQVTVRQGETCILYGQSTVSTGTLTLMEGSTFTLRDASNAVVTGFPAGTTGYDTAAAATVKVWYQLDTSYLKPGVYYGLFSYILTASSDGLQRLDVPDIQVIVLPAVHAVATYDLTTAVGKVRFWVRDTDLSAPTFSDAELQLFVDQAGLDSSNNPRLFRAAYYGLMALATDASKIAAVEKIGVFGTDSYKTWQAITAQAKLVNELDMQGVTPYVLENTAGFDRYIPDTTVISGVPTLTSSSDKSMRQW